MSGARPGGTREGCKGSRVPPFAPRSKPPCHTPGRPQRAATAPGSSPPRPLPSSSAGSGDATRGALILAALGAVILVAAVVRELIIREVLQAVGLRAQLAAVGGRRPVLLILVLARAEEAVLHRVLPERAGPFLSAPARVRGRWAHEPFGAPPHLRHVGRAQEQLQHLRHQAVKDPTRILIIYMTYI